MFASPLQEEAQAGARTTVCREGCRHSGSLSCRASGLFLLKSMALTLFFFPFLSGVGQRPDLICGLAFIKVSECSGLTLLNVRSDAWLFSLLMSCITEILGYRIVLELNM